VNGFEHFGEKAILDEHINCAQNGHEVNKIGFSRVHQYSQFDFRIFVLS